MIKHRQIRRLMYDYLVGELTTDERNKLDLHLAKCIKCTKELAGMRSVVGSVSQSDNQPSEERPVEFWQSFASTLDKKIRDAAHKEQRRGPTYVDKLLWLLTIHPRRIAASGTIAIAVLLGFFIWRQSQEAALKQSSLSTKQPSHEVVVANDRMNQYLRKSKVLLVGLTNMKMNEDESIDLSAERKLSRELVHEARYLRQQPQIDARSAKLISDLEKILIELANMKKENDLPNIEIIRGGIHQENLLFKIRMAESVHGSPTFTNASYTSEGNIQ